MVKEGQKFKIVICRNNMRKHYEERGYKISQLGETIEVDAKDLTKGSKFKIKYICDYCGEEFERLVQSNERSKKDGNNKDACSKCSKSKKSKETCLLKYGVDNPMKVEEIQQKCEQARIDNPNFTGSTFLSSSGFVNGIPVSKAQYNLYQLLPDFKLNYHYRKYYIDLAKDNIAIEYDGKGHDLEVRMGKMALEEFEEKEQIKENILLEKYRLLRIVDKKDKLKKEERCAQIKEQIDNFISGNSKYEKIVID